MLCMWGVCVCRVCVLYASFTNGKSMVTLFMFVLYVWVWGCIQCTHQVSYKIPHKDSE